MTAPDRTSHAILKTMSGARGFWDRATARLPAQLSSPLCSLLTLLTWSFRELMGQVTLTAVPLSRLILLSRLTAARRPISLASRPCPSPCWRSPGPLWSPGSLGSPSATAFLPQGCCTCCSTSTLVAGSGLLVTPADAVCAKSCPRSPQFWSLHSPRHDLYLTARSLLSGHQGRAVSGSRPCVPASDWAPGRPLQLGRVGGRWPRARPTLAWRMAGGHSSFKQTQVHAPPS